MARCFFIPSLISFKKVVSSLIDSNKISLNSIALSKSKFLTASFIAGVSLLFEYTYSFKYCSTSVVSNCVGITGFSVVLSQAVVSEFYLEVDGNERAKKYRNTNATMQFMDFFLLGVGLHQITVKAKAESRASISSREARLGVYL